MKKTIGILAHVDAGKTTFTEQLLYRTGSIRNLGRVDHKTSCMDTDEIERKRGITIFADQGIFNFKKDTYYIIDTPGHVDFSAEAERSISVLDYAIMLISGTSGIQAHTITLFRLLKYYEIPIFFFINKTDIDGFDLSRVLADIKNKLTSDILYLHSIDDVSKMNQQVAEFVAERDETFMEAYLDEEYTVELLQSSLVGLIRKQQCFPVMSGSALKGEGIETFLEVFSTLSPTNFAKNEEEDIRNREDNKGDNKNIGDSLGDSLPVSSISTNSSFVGTVYKIRHDENENRLTFIKALSGKLHLKDEFIFKVAEEIRHEKINEIRVYNGKKYINKSVVFAGDVFAVTGLKTPVCGTVLELTTETTPIMGTVNKNNRKTETEMVTVNTKSVNYHLVSALQSKINILDETDINTCLEKLRVLEAEDPMLAVTFQKETGDILVNVMGKIQLEVLEQLIATRFGISIAFEKPRIQYRETIASPVVGYGHFEPLRHYAEVQLRLEPNARGKGITFASECHVDILALNYQRLIEGHVFEKVHKGILTGSPITDINIVLQDGRAHLKHTSGGDFREATYRAIRQGLEKAESILLEPFYQFEINIEPIYLGRVMSDIQKMRGTYELPVQTGENICVRGRGPVETFMDYSSELVAFTRGKGSISFIFDGYDICEIAEEVIERIGYEKDRDIENTSSSVFCAKGTSFIVPWNEAEKYMHTI